MADKRIQDLTPATSVSTADLFVLEQSGEAKSLSGQVLITDLATALDGHGGISNITYAPPVSPSLSGTMTITMADNTQYTVTVRDGNGIASIAIAYGISAQGTTPAYVTSWSNTPTPPTDANPYQWTRIRITGKTNTVTDAYSVSLKASDPTISIGTVTAAGGASAAATVTNSGTVYNPTLNFDFTLPQGDKGDTGDYIEPVASFGTSTAAATEPTTWYNSPTSLSYAAGNFIWQKTEYTLHDAGTVQSTEKKIIGYIGQNGSGSGTVQQITFNGTVFADDGTGNVPMTVDAADVGAIAEPSTASNGQVLTYDSSAGEWVAANPSTGNVNTVNNKGVDTGTTNITLYGTDIKMSSVDSTTIPNAIPAASSATPQPLGTAAAGSATTWARGDHVHKKPTPSELGVVAMDGSNPGVDPVADLDNFLTGVALFSSSTTHFPSGGTYYLVIAGGQSGTTTQVAYDLFGGNPAVARYCAGGTWSAWADIKSQVQSVNSKTGVVSLNADDVGAMSKWVLLWENASPTSSFAPQDIAVDLSGYDILCIEVIRHAGVAQAVLSTIFDISAAVSYIGTILSYAANLGWRDFNIDSNKTKITVSNAYYIATYGTWVGTVDNQSIIPYKIFGIKGVQTS